MSGIAHLSFKGGGWLVLSVHTPYERQLLVEHVEASTRRHGRSRLEINRRRWTISTSEGLARSAPPVASGRTSSRTPADRLAGSRWPVHRPQRARTIRASWRRVSTGDPPRLTVRFSGACPCCAVARPARVRQLWWSIGVSENVEALPSSASLSVPAAMATARRDPRAARARESGEGTQPGGQRRRGTRALLGRGAGRAA